MNRINWEDEPIQQPTWIELVNIGQQRARFEIWCEGFQANGESGKANLLEIVEVYSNNLEELTFNNAVSLYKEKYPHKNIKGNGTEVSPFTYWGCRLFDNELDARKSFG